MADLLTAGRAGPFTKDHNMIREVARGFLQDWYDGGQGPEKIYQSGQAYDPEAWKIFTQDLGMAGVAIDEQYGGTALGDLGRVVVMEELGASLCAVPFLTTCGIVVDVLNRVGEDAAKAIYLPKIAAGELKAAYCDGHKAVDKVVSHVAYADQADVILLSRQVPDGLDYFAIQSGAAGLIITPEKTMDPTRSFARVDWSQVAEVDLEVIGYGSHERHAKMITQSFIGLAAECIGGAQKCLDMTLEHASSEAIKQRCSDMLTLIEASRSTVYAATVASLEEKTEAAILAKAYAVDAFFKIAEDATQLHGEIGSEYPLHFFFKRARENKSMYGS